MRPIGRVQPRQASTGNFKDSLNTISDWKGTVTGWMEVFKTGTHVSANGVRREWTLSDLQQMAETYDPKTHEAPIVVGHPKDNAPAFGWIKELKIDGSKLMALPRPGRSGSLPSWSRRGSVQKAIDLALS